MAESLIERLEKATGPDRALDGAIWAIAQPAEFERQCSFKGRKHAGHIHTPAEKRAHTKRMVAYLSPEYTASLDAAITLVPTGMHWIAGAGKTRPEEPLYGAQIRRPFPDSEDVVGEGETDASAALALCIAALRARTP